MRRMRGFTLMHLGLVLAIVVALGALVWWADANIETSAGIAKGEQNKQGEWDRANAKAKEDAEEREKVVQAAIDEAEEEKEDADARARDADQRWKEAVRESRRNNDALAVCEAGAPPAVRPVGDAGIEGPGIRPPTPREMDAVGAHRAARVLLTWQLVRDYDRAWTGLDGQPVFQVAASGEGAPAAGAASPYGLEDLREVHGENAIRCSADRRELAALIREIELAEKAWSRAP